MKATITDGKVVALHYRLTLDDGTVADDSFEGEPMTYTQGSGSLVPGLEKGLKGRVEGDEFTLVVPPAEGYGYAAPNAEQIVARAQFPAGIDIEPGMTFRVQGAKDVIPVWVVRASSDEVVLTQNHPLAGKDLRFDVRVLEVRAATPEEAAPPST